MPSWTLWKVALRLALILMTLSLFPCRTVESPDDVAAVPFGSPIPFIVLDARDAGPAVFPARLCFGDPRRRPTRLLPLPALADLVLLTLASVALIRAFTEVRSRWRRHRSARRRQADRRPGRRR